MKNYNRSNPLGREKSFKRGGGRDSRRPEMHEAICDDCGSECEVPFKPSGGRPIYCSSCFEKNNSESSARYGRERERGGRDSRKRMFSDRNSNRPTMHQTVCDKCGSECEVPFRPTPGKPIFCDNCFEHGGNKKDKDTDLLKKEIDILNQKLDKILKILTPVISEKKNLKEAAKEKKEIKDPKPEKKTKSTTKTKTAAKKTAAPKKVAKKKK